MAMSTKKTDLLGRDVTNLGLGTGYKTSFVNKANTSKKKKTKKPTYSAAGIEVDPSYYATSGSGGSYSASGTRWYDVTKSDISGLLNAYEQQAASNRQAAENKYNTTRNDLLTALKRYQEQNARDVKNQKQSYLSEQSNLESARESANRQSRISAAARGLGGSGLQQLAQLQNLIGQSEKVSEAAGKNQAAMEALANSLKEYTEDNETAQKNALTDYNDTLRSIASTLANQKAQAIAENEQAYTNAINARNAAMAQYSYSGSPGTAGSSGYEDAQSAALLANQQISNITDVLNAIQGMSKSQLKKYTKSSSLFGNKALKTPKDAYNYLKNYTTNSVVNSLYNANVDANTINKTTNTINSLLKNGTKIISEGGRLKWLFKKEV